MNFNIVRILAILVLVTSLSAFADESLGADKAAVPVSTFLKTLSLRQNTIIYLSDSDTENLIALAAKLHINVFELLDCIYR